MRDTGSREESEKRARSIEGASEISSEVNSVSGKTDYKRDASARMSNVIVEMWEIKLSITDAQREGNSAESVMEQDILRLCKTKKKQNSRRGAGGPRRPVFRRRGGAPHNVEAEDKQGDDCEYAFGISDDSNVSRFLWK